MATVLDPLVIALLLAAAHVVAPRLQRQRELLHLALVLGNLGQLESVHTDLLPQLEELGACLVDLACLHRDCCTRIFQCALQAHVSAVLAAMRCKSLTLSSRPSAIHVLRSSR